MESTNFVATAVTGALAVLSLLLLGWQWLEARRFPVHRRLAADPNAPGLTVLKPLKGCDAETRTCLASWLEQDYPGPVQFLCGVASLDDPVCEVVRALAAEHPDLDVRLELCPERRGNNGKMSTLSQLEPGIANDLVVLSDADVRVPADLLSQLVATWKQEQAALVQCFYAMTNPANAAMRIEALAINADFWPQVLQARRLAPLDFALGAALLTHRARLDSIGKFEGLADYLADDFQLGHRLARAGGRIALCTVVVECRHAPQSWQEVWHHQVRWARTIRISRPLPYFFSILNNVTLWIALFCVAGFAVPLPARLAGGLVACALRFAVARDAERRLTAPLAGTRSAWWIPASKDLLQAVLWACSFLGNTVRWRGERFRVRRGGKLERMSA